MKSNNTVRIETMRIGTVRTTFRWDMSKGKKPVITRTTATHTVPEEGSLCSIVEEEVPRTTLL